MTTVLPMFPLGSVLFPTVVLPLHVFEPRYRRLLDDSEASDGEFGVVLIERGSEVGGGDVRTDVGTVARVLQRETFDDGRSAVVAVGVRRIRILRWLEDDPYPRAEVEDWPDPAPATLTLDEVGDRFRRTLALAAELGEAAAPLDIALDTDPSIASFQIAALAPLGPADRQAVLAVEAADDRIATLVALLDDATELLRARLGG